MIIEDKEKETVIKYSLKERIVILLKGKTIIPDDFLNRIITTLAIISFQKEQRKKEQNKE
jgi:hypothetical protein